MAIGQSFIILLIECIKKWASWFAMDNGKPS